MLAWLKKRRGRVVMVVALGGPALVLVSALTGETYLMIDAQSDVMNVKFSHGRPLDWPVEGFTLVDCRGLIGADAPRPDGRPLSQGAERGSRMQEGAFININGAERGRPGRAGVAAGVAIDRGDLVITLRALDQRGNEEPGDTACNAVSDGARLHGADGGEQPLRLPAQLRLPGADIGEGISLEYRGEVRAGTDVASGRQPLLNSGTVVLRHVRPSWLQALGASPSFDIDQRQLGTGDKVFLSVQAVTDPGDVPQGFARVSLGDTGPVMSLHAISLAARAELARPYSDPERPRAHLLKRLVRDEALQLWLTYWASIFGILLSSGELLARASRLLARRRVDKPGVARNPP